MADDHIQRIESKLDDALRNTVTRAELDARDHSRDQRLDRMESKLDSALALGERVARLEVQDTNDEKSATRSEGRRSWVIPTITSVFTFFVTLFVNALAFTGRHHP